MAAGEGAKAEKAQLLALCDGHAALAARLGVSPLGRSGRSDGGPPPAPPGELGRKQALIFGLVERLAATSPTAAPVAGMGPGSASPLDGRWRLRFTTAGDAKPPGVGETYQEVQRGEITNVLLFPEPSPIERIEVRLEGSAASATRVRLVFDRVRTIWREPQWFTLWQRETEVQLPRPGTPVAEFLARITNADRQEGAYFEVVYLDDTLRIHRTAEGNVFIQTRDTPDS